VRIAYTRVHFGTRPALRRAVPVGRACTVWGDWLLASIGAVLASAGAEGMGGQVERPMACQWSSGSTRVEGKTRRAWEQIGGLINYKAEI
jgi:hypothetical protein